MADRVLILGASARAAAASARRAGLDPFAIDLFADADTEQICDCLRCPPDRYPEGLFELAKQAPPMPWMYTGGLENHPKLIDRLAKCRRLLGNWSTHIKVIRDPYKLHAILTAHGIPTPAVCPMCSRPPGEGHWLTKPFRGSSGQGVAWHDTLIEGLPRPSYIQKFVPGTAMSAVYVGMFWRVYFLAATLQLIGQTWLHARPFVYCGNVGPIELPETSMSVLRHIGGIVTQFGPRFGLFGVDFVLDEAGQPNPVEVNPRYPASAEILDHAFGESMLKWHVECASILEHEDYEEEWRGPVDFSRRAVFGKAIYYTPQRLTFPASGPWDESVRRAADVWRRPDFADVPHPGEAIEAGHPMLTILTEADTESECLSRLQSRAAELDRLFGFPTPEGESCRP